MTWEEKRLLVLEQIHRKATSGEWTGFRTGILRQMTWVVSNGPAKRTGYIMKKVDADAIATIHNAAPWLFALAREAIEARHAVRMCLCGHAGREHLEGGTCQVCRCDNFDALPVCLKENAETRASWCCLPNGHPGHHVYSVCP